MASHVLVPEVLNKSISDFPYPFNQAASVKLADLCHESYPEQLKEKNVIKKVRDFFNLFGFEFFDHPQGIPDMIGVRVLN